MTERVGPRSKYDALAEYLQRQEADEVELTFDEIDEIVGGLPPGARENKSAWANTYANARAEAGWMRIGWRVPTPNLAEQRIRFIRETSDRWQGRSFKRRADVQRAWLVRAQDRSLVPEWLALGYCSVATPGIGEIEESLTRRDITNRIAEVYDHLGYGSRAALTATINAFLNDMDVGDLVVTIGGSRGDEVYIGEITGDPVLEGAKGLTGRWRAVAWANPRHPLQRDQLLDPFQSKLKGQRAITELSAELETLKQLVQIDHETEQVAAEQSADLELPDPDPELATRLFLPLDWLQETVELLRWKKQMIFYGPPGTGKTYLAKRLAEHLTAPENVRLVQFHPAYSYEDFFEGYRPQQTREGSGQIVFELAPGPLRRVVEDARQDPASPFVLIIDEINRAHPAKVFGELYFLLEYREEPIELLYSPAETDFRLPENLFLIGTMNTADRSIALVDVAMRRRFVFRGLYPDREPIGGLLRAWLKQEGHPPDAADLLDELNRRIGQPDYSIGPSYLMNDQVKDGDGLRRIWESMILPLLEEHFFGEARNVAQEFGLVTLREAVAQGSASPS